MCHGEILEQHTERTASLRTARSPVNMTDIATLAHLPFVRKEHHRRMRCLVAELTTKAQEVNLLACGGRASR